MLKRPSFKNEIIGCLILCSTIMACGGAEPQNQVQPEVKDSMETATEPGDTKDTPEKLKEQLTFTLGLLEQPSEVSRFKKSMNNPRLVALAFGVWANMIEKGKASSLTENVALANALMPKVAATQLKEYPSLRKWYVSVLPEKQSNFNGTAKASGPRNSTIVLTSKAFTDKGSIGQFHANIEKELLLFRFKKAVYKSSSSKEENIYTLESPNDEAVQQLQQ